MTLPFALEQTVYIEDTNQFGVVYYANYLKYFERARTEWLNAQDFSLQQCIDQAIFFVVKDVAISFRCPLRLHDRFVVTAKPIKATRSSITFEQTLYIAGQPEKTYCNGSVLLVAVNPKYKVIRIPRGCLQLRRATRYSYMPWPI